MSFSEATHNFPPFIPGQHVLRYLGVDVTKKYCLFVPKDLSDTDLKVHLTDAADPLRPIKSVDVYDALFVDQLSFYLRPNCSEELWSSEELTSI